MHGIGQSGVTSPVELLGEKDVLGDVNRILQQPMDEDDLDPDERASLLDDLGGDLADVRDELQLQVVRLSAKAARTHVGRHILPLEVERAVHGYSGLLGRSERGVTVQRVSLTREKGRVAFNLDQIKVAGGIDHLFEQPRGVYLGVGEAHPMGAHVFGVAADVSDHEESTPGLHAGDPN
jgi:hypothetical protein